ncbi:MAG: hypothetical protein ACP5PV_07325 [Methanothrix sp.]
MNLKQQPQEEIIKKAYELQKVLEKESHQLELHKEEYKKLLEIIATYDTQRAGHYEAIKTIHKRRYIIQDLFRKKWPGLFNRFAKVTIKDAKTELEDDIIETVCGFSEVIQWKFVFHDE